ncbi:MAG TPA: glycosyltransferase family 39 protein [Ktedonobacterales bacterium]|nr:glycosyltransferase family 39 protein [Ktedonobacterales bacterium]
MRAALLLWFSPSWSVGRRAWLRQHGFFLLVLLLALFFLTINVAQPWVSLHEDNGLAFSSIAVNDLRYGLGVTKGQSLADHEALNSKSPLGIPGVPPGQEFQYLLTGPTHPYFYCDHPPLLGLTIAGAIELVGMDFWVVRLVPLLYSLAVLIVFYCLALALVDRGVAQFASLLFASFPMFAYFGRDVAHEAPVLFWTLLLVTGYVHWKRSSQKRWLWLMGASIVIGEGYDWPLFYFAFLLFLVEWVASRRFDLRLALAVLVPALLTLLLIFAQITWVLDGHLGALLNNFLGRSSGNNYQGQPFGFINWFRQMLLWNFEGYGLWSPALLCCAVVLLAKRARAEGWSLWLRVLAMLLLFGLSHIILFPNGAFYHAYWQFYLLPLYALSCGYAAVTLARRCKTTSRRMLVLAGTGTLCVLLNLPIIIGLYMTISGVFVPLI